MQTMLTWTAGGFPPAFHCADFRQLLARVRQPLHLLLDSQANRLGLGLDGSVDGTASAPGRTFQHVGTLPALYPEWLGDRAFLETHGVRFAYVGGAMARGIASAELTIALARSGALGFFGAAGLSLEAVARDIARIKQALDPLGLPYGANLIHSPDEPELEDQLVDLYLARDVRRVSASAYMSLMPSVVRYAATGLRRDASGRIRRRNYVFAKISRPEIARLFMAPPPDEMLETLYRAGRLSAEEIQLARTVPIAEDVTVESDSGGHTDNRPLGALFPVIARLRDAMQALTPSQRPIRVGAAGGLGTPEAVAAAFSMGASYVLVGSVHQAAIESGLSEEGRRLLARAGLADVMMTAAGDMFEMGVKLQVLKQGTMMGIRGNQLWELYHRHDSIDSIPADIRERIERTVFRMPLEAVWQKVRAYLSDRPLEIERAEGDPKVKMARIFKWYLGMSSRWPLEGATDRILDYQIWCGPAMGAFNSWVRGSFLEPPEARTVRQMALNLMEGAAVVTRAQQARSFGLPVPPEAFSYAPVPLAITD